MKIQFLLIVGLLVQLVHTAPDAPISPQVDVQLRDTTTTPSLLKREGYHRASVYSLPSCAGPAILDVENFGCGGACHKIESGGGYSMYLQHRKVGNPKPTADLYFTTNCTGQRAHAGIWAKHLAGCTEIKNKTARWMSVYLWFDC